MLVTWWNPRAKRWFCPWVLHLIFDGYNIMILVKGYRIGMKEENQYEDAVFEGNFEGYDVYVSDRKSVV